MELAGPIVELLKCASASISRCWKYHRNLEENMHILRQRLEQLNRRKEDIQLRLQAELVEGETTLRHEVEFWLQRVGLINTEINNFERKVEQVKFCCRASSGKDVISKIAEVEDLYGSGEFAKGLVITLPQRTGDILPTTILGGQTTARRNMEEVWESLMDEEVRKIGVYGMAGIGKTTVMKHINNRLLGKRDHKFDNVIWVTASQASSVGRLQGAIARKLELDISRYDDETTKAAKLYDALSRKNKYLLIIDDLWQVYRLEDVGIPEPTRKNGCKLVLTTRDLKVCHGMDCRPIQMRLLSEEEALSLFLDAVGGGVLSVPNLRETLKLVVKECDCLPLAVVTIAGSLKGVVDNYEWKIALKDLKASAKRNTNEIFEKLRFSYDRLNDSSLQACLRFCALYPEDYEIDREALIGYLIDEGIIKERNRQGDFERGRAMLNKLVHACLLEDAGDETEEKDCVKMHDLIRDMVLQITRESPRFLVEAGVGLKCIPDEENWKEDLAKVSLMHNAILTIPSSIQPPKCPTLSTLLLNGNRRLNSISDDFFSHMKGLVVLDLSDTSIVKLPESVSELVNLTALLLRKCHELRYVPCLEKLTALKKLDFFLSGIKQVPQGMQKLAKLRYLNLDECELETIPDGNVSNLSNLQYLCVGRQWGAKLRGEELANLRKLEDLYCVLYDIDSFNAYIRSVEELGGPESHYILQLGITGEDGWCVVRKQYDKAVYLTNCDIGESVATDKDQCPLLLPPDVEILAIKNCHAHVSNLCELTSFENATKFKSCCVYYCRGLEHLFAYSSSIISLLQSLEMLDLEGLSDLRALVRKESIGSSLLPPGTFSSLKELRISRCNNIERLSIASPLPNLQEINVFRCQRLVEIIPATFEDEEIEDQNEEGITLPKLVTLSLFLLPKLENMPVVSDSLRKVTLWGCPKLKRIPFLDREPCPPSLQRVWIGGDMWGSLEWNHTNAKDTIQSMIARH